MSANPLLTVIGSPSGNIYPQQVKAVADFNILAIVSEWLRANKLTLNVSKTRYYIFRRHHLVQLTKIK